MESKVWHDATRPSSTRIDALLAEMTLEEKVAQLGSVWIGFQMDGDPASAADDGTVSPFQDAYVESSWDTMTVDGLGHITRPFGTKPVSAREGALQLIAMQQRLVDETRLGVPATAHEECLTGFTTLGATIYPAPLSLAATFDEALIERVTARIGADLRAVGVHHALSPVLDVVRDYRWGRVEETFGEDPYLVAIAGAAYVRGLQSAGIVATLKHFVGYSASRAARNHAPVSMGRRELLDVMLPPFEMAVREAGVGSVMNSYTDIDGVPAASDPWLFTDLLRAAMGFTGVVVSDYWAISLLKSVHRVAATDADAGGLALTAGIDVELPSTECYGRALVGAVRDGRVDEELVERSARRVLQQKIDQGLLDGDYDPTRGVDLDIDLDSEQNRALARAAAEQAVVLLRNDGLLPLQRSSGTIAVIGPCADDPLAFLGCYSYPNHVLGRYPALGTGLPVPTLLDAVRAEFAGITVTTHPGCPVKVPDERGIAGAVDLASDADVTIVVVGDRAGLFGQGTSGEGCDAADLTFPGSQGRLLDAVLDTGTPTIVVSVSGRPYAMGHFADRAAAVVQAFMPGEEAGSAIVGVLSGRINPSGRLPVQVPAEPFGQPATSVAPRYGQPGLNVSSVESPVLYPFGHGLSYTTFEYGPLRLETGAIESGTVDTGGTFHASVTVANVGSVHGAEVVQLYFTDPVAETARPLQMLLGVARVELAPNQRRRVSFEVHTDRLAYHGRAGTRIVDPGDIVIKVGGSAGAISSRATITVTGSTREVPFDRVLRTPVIIVDEDAS